MTAEQTLMIQSIRVAVKGECGVLSIEDIDWPVFLDLAGSHGLLPLVCDGLQKTPGVWQQISQTVRNDIFSVYMQAVYRDSQQEYTKQQLVQKLTNANVSHVLLKGAVLKYDYPEPALRTMSDMDLLVYAEDFDRIAEVAKSLGAKAVSGDGNHRNYVFPGRVAVEFHPNLLHHASAIGTGINPGWQYAKEQSGVSKELTEEGLYLNTLCHLAHHFVNGGVGVRFVLDVWVSRHLRKTQPNRAFVEEELTRFGLLEFTEKIEQLAETWFGDMPTTPLLEELGEYILTSGSHGTEAQAMLNAMSLSPGGSRMSALWKKAFYPKAELEDRFPWCKGKPLLLPAAWCCRAYTAITQHGHIIAKWSKDTGKISKEQVTENQNKLKRFGIRSDNH